MKLTPEQLNEMRRARAAGDKRVTIDFTDEQKSEWEAAVREEFAGKEDNAIQVHKIKEAGEQPGFFGDPIASQHIAAPSVAARQLRNMMPLRTVISSP
jgi:hypothetical protein